MTNNRQYNLLSVVFISLILALTAILIAIFSVLSPLSLSHLSPITNNAFSANDPYTIRVVTLNGPTTYFVNNQQQYSGLEYELAQRFVEYLGAPYKLKIFVATHIGEIIPALIHNNVDIAAADLSITDSRKEMVNFASAYLETQQQLVYNKNLTTDPPKNLKELANVRIVVPTGTSFVERLNALKEQEPSVTWEERETHSEHLIEAVANGEIPYTIADSHLISVMHNFHPELGTSMPIGKTDHIAWAVSKDSKPELQEKARSFFNTIKKNGTLRNLVDRYYGNAKRLNTIDITTFMEHTQTLLPKYIGLFKQAQDITGIDWHLIAAVSYRESHWDTYSTSPTNVRGLMMLTEDTADQMGVTDRLDPKQSIPAGAKYLRRLIETVPNKVPEPDRTYMALAAYNIGYAHVEDARVLAQRLKLNPNHWADVKKTLVMLNDPTYYINAKYGYCSGGAPVIFVETIRSYQRILDRYQSSELPTVQKNVAQKKDF